MSQTNPNSIANFIDKILWTKLRAINSQENFCILFKECRFFFFNLSFFTSKIGSQYPFSSYLCHLLFFLFFFTGKAGGLLVVRGRWLKLCEGGYGG